MGNNHKFANIGLNMKKNKVVKTGIIFSQNIKTTTIYKCVRPWIPRVDQGRMECFAESAWMAKSLWKEKETHTEYANYNGPTFVKL